MDAKMTRMCTVVSKERIIDRQQMQKRFTIVIPTYNGESFLKEAILSVQEQTRLPDELIIVDDASTDGTVELASKLAEECGFPLVIIQLRENSGGPSKPINTGVAKAKGDFVLVLDQDDVLASKALANLEDAFLNNPSAACAFHLAGMHEHRLESRTCRSQDMLKNLENAIPKIGKYRFAKKETLCSLLFRYGNFLVGFPGFAFRKQEFMQKGGVPVSLRIAGDLDLLFRFFLHYDAVYVPEIGYYRREHELNACRNASRMFFEIGLVYSNVITAASHSFDAQDLKAVAEYIQTTAYWFRKANMFHHANLLYRSLKVANVPMSEIAICLAKCNLERMYAFIVRRKPLITTITRNTAI